MTSLQTATAVLGGLLMVGALASGLARRSLLSLASVFVLAGFALGPGASGILGFAARSPFVHDLAYCALVVILLRDGLEVEGEMLQRAWRLPLRKLVLAMPITAGLVALCAHLLVGLSWSEALLLGALLAPTDPVLTSTIVTDQRVPALVRHSLNLESGLNDGLALPAVLALLAALTPAAQGHFVWWHFVSRDIGLGLAFGLACGGLASLLMPRGAPKPRKLIIPEHQRSLYVLGVGFATYGITVVSLRGNGLIAVFVAAIVLGVRRPDLRGDFERGANELVEVLKLGIFVVFGSLLTLHGLLHDGWAAVGVVALTFLVIRPVAVWASLAGTSTDTPTRLFLGWFGPKGVATMTFSLLVLDAGIPGGSRIFDLAALAVFCSVIVHGLSDTPGARFIARHAARVTERDHGEVPRPAGPQAVARP